MALDIKDFEECIQAFCNTGFCNYHYKFIPCISESELSLVNQKSYRWLEYCRGHHENLTFTDFYTVVPDDASLNDLMKIYDMHRPFIEEIPNYFEDSKDKKYVDYFYNKHTIPQRIGIDYIYEQAFLLSVFTKEEFENTIKDHAYWIFTGNYTNIDVLRPLCTIKNAIRCHYEWLEEMRKRFPEYRGRNDAKRDWWRTYTEDYKYAIIKILPRYIKEYGGWDHANVSVDFYK